MMLIMGSDQVELAEREMLIYMPSTARFGCDKMAEFGCDGG